MKVTIKYIAAASVAAKWAAKWAALKAKEHEGYYAHQMTKPPKDGGPGFGVTDDGAAYWRTCNGNFTSVKAEGNSLIVTYDGSRHARPINWPDIPASAPVRVVDYKTSESHLKWDETAWGGIERAPEEAILRLLKTSRCNSAPGLLKNPLIAPIKGHWGRSAERKTAAELTSEELRFLRRLEAAWKSVPGRFERPW